jgi:hypothetical protein
VKLLLRVHATTMAPLITHVAAIVAGKINIKLRVRVVHVWTVSEFNNPNEDNSIHMLLLDDKVGFLKLYNVVLYFENYIWLRLFYISPLFNL